MAEEVKQTEQTATKEVKLNTYNVDEQNQKSADNVAGVEKALGNKVMTLADKIEAAKNSLANNSNLFKDENAEANMIKNDFTSAIEESLKNAFDSRGRFDSTLFFKKFDEINNTVMPDNKTPLADNQESELIYDVEKK